VEPLLSPQALARDVERLGAGEYLVDPLDLIEDALAFFTPPEKISTLECAERYRKFRTTEGGALVPYDRRRTPYNIGKMAALDDPRTRLVVNVKPSRSGGTTVAENYLFKMMLFGPMGDVGWYLGAQDAVKKYCDRIIKPLFEDHPDLRSRVGIGRSDDNDTSKRVSGHLIEWLPSNDAAWRNREFVFGVADEPDGWAKYSETPVTQLEGRMKGVGKRGKKMVLSHPDKGWRAGVAAAWESTSRGIFVMRCAECDHFATAHATKYWPDVPEFKLAYERMPRADADTRIELAERTAGMSCPHCGVVLTDKQRFAMIDAAAVDPACGIDGWLHRGMTFDPVHGVSGEPEQFERVGFWDHGLMLKVSPAAELARTIEEALIKFERSGGKRVKELREALSKLMGEIFDGKAGIDGVNAASLRKRARGGDDEASRGLTYPVGMCPSDVVFITAAIDVGAAKFDVSFRGWDREGRSWWLDRLTLRQNTDANGVLRNIATRERIEDWDMLVDQVVRRTFPVIGANHALPVALTVIDVSDGHVTWIGREFAARCYRAGLVWGRVDGGWPRVQLLQGSPSDKAPELPPKPRLEDAKGRRFPKGVKEWSPGVFKLKELALERLAITDGSPGQCYFASGILREYFDEYFNEPLIDGKFDRQGPNESLDLFAYEEAARLIVNPDRESIWANGALPLWARPVPLLPEGGDPLTGARATAGQQPKTDATTAATALLQRFQASNRRN